MAPGRSNGESVSDCGPDGAVVLVVEDDQEIRAALEETLLEAGYQVAGVRHGQEALAYLRDHPPPAAIVLDLLMPTMNGWDFVNRLRGDSTLAATPIVVVTATGPHWGYPVPASMVVRKPFQRQHLLGVIRQATTAQGAPII